MKRKIWALLIFSSLCIAVGCGGSDDGGSDKDKHEPMICNGSEKLCDRKYSDVSFPGAHNAMSSAEDGWVAPNQEYALVRQLEDGVRVFLLDIYYQAEGVVSSKDWDTVMLCHGYCNLGSRPLAEALADFEKFTRENPNEIISFVFQSYVPASIIEAEFAAAGLVDRLYAHPLGAEWPTLREMINDGKTIVALTEDGRENDVAWYHRMYEDEGWDNPYAADYPEDLTCTVLRGDPEHKLFQINHFLTNPLPSPESAEQVNNNPFFINHIKDCIEISGRIPNFIVVDFYSIGDLFAVVDEVNAMQDLPAGE